MKSVNCTSVVGVFRNFRIIILKTSFQTSRFVSGYEESSTICGNIIILSASGTAAIVNNDVSTTRHPLIAPVTSPTHAPGDVDERKSLHVDVALANRAAVGFVAPLVVTTEASDK